MYFEPAVQVHPGGDAADGGALPEVMPEMVARGDAGDLKRTDNTLNLWSRKQLTRNNATSNKQYQIILQRGSR